MSLRLFTRPAAALARAKRIIKLALLNLGLFLLAWPLATQATPAQENFENLQRFGLSVYGQNVPRTPTEIVASLVTILLGFLSTLFVILILIAGFQWMTSGGNEQKVESESCHYRPGHYPYLLLYQLIHLCLVDKSCWSLDDLF